MKPERKLREWVKNRRALVRRWWRRGLISRRGYRERLRALGIAG